MLVPCLVAALTLGLAPAEASGAGETIELRWAAPAGCPQRDQVRALVERLVPSVGPGLRAEATIEAVAGGFRGMLALWPGEARQTVRRLEAEDCMVLARAMAVVIAVSMDPVGVAESERTAEVPESPPSSDELASDGTASGRARARGAANEGERAGSDASDASLEAGLALRGAADRRSAGPLPARGGLEGGMRLGAGVGGLLLPAAGVGLSLAAFVGTARVHVRAVAQYWAPQRVAFDPTRDASGELQLVTGGARACPQLGWGRVRIPLCAGVDAGAMIGRGTGHDLVTSRSAREPWVGAVFEPGVTVGVTSRVSLWLALEGVVSLHRPQFVIEGAPQTWTAGAGAVRGLFGVQVHARRNRPQNP